MRGMRWQDENVFVKDSRQDEERLIDTQRNDVEIKRMISGVLRII